MKKVLLIIRFSHRPEFLKAPCFYADNLRHKAISLSSNRNVSIRPKYQYTTKSFFFQNHSKLVTIVTILDVIFNHLCMQESKIRFIGMNGFQLHSLK